MTRWNRVEDVLLHRYVTDVLVPGRVDRDDEPIAVFRPQPLVVFVRLEDRLRCTTVRPFTDAGSKPEEGLVKCLALELESRYWLFFDPTWPFGIRVGNAEDMRRWNGSSR